MKTKHTPGPWRADRGSVIGPDGLSIASTGNSSRARYPAERGANARLMAAAPSLLVACEAALQWLGPQTESSGSYEVCHQLRAAIRKAGGSVEIEPAQGPTGGEES